MSLFKKLKFKVGFVPVQSKRQGLSLVLLGLLVGLQGCATSKKTTQTTPSLPLANSVEKSSQSSSPGELMGPPEAFGPPLSDAEQRANPVELNSYGPQPVQIRPLVLVLGPGLARGYAYAGVFQALKASKIPIAAVIGTEMGGLIGALFAMSSNTNQLEWGLLRLKEDLFKENSGLLARLNKEPSDGVQFENQLKQLFGKKDLNQAKTPIWIGILPENSDTPLLVNHGSVAQAIRATMADPSLFSAGPFRVNNETIHAKSTAKIHPYFVNEAISLGMGPVVVVDVLADSESAGTLDGLKGADLVIKPDVHDIGIKDFQKKTDAAFRGKDAIIHHIAEIRRLVGLAETTDRNSN